MLAPHHAHLCRRHYGKTPGKPSDRERIWSFTVSNETGVTFKDYRLALISLRVSWSQKKGWRADPRAAWKDLFDWASGQTPLCLTRVNSSVALTVISFISAYPTLPSTSHLQHHLIFSGNV
jgi:hypothetical protein